MDMRSRKTLAANVNALMATKPGLSSPRQVVKAGGATNGTLGRIRNGEVGASVDQLDQLARVFGVEPWQLLVPNLDPKSLPVLGGMPTQYRKLLEKVRVAAAQADDIEKLIDTHTAR
jgi:transcriptional regulator with XRE-family HTH domain